MENSAYEGLAHTPKPVKQAKDKRKHGIARTFIEHNHDGSHQVEHHYKTPGKEPSKHGAENLEALHDLLEEHLGGKPTAAELEG